MSDRQTLSKRFGAPQTSPNTHGTKELLIKSSRERPLKPFNSRDLSRKDRLQLIWKFLLTIFAIILLVVSLWGFSRLGLLSKWEQRPFNMLSILLSGIASLGVGSLLGHLGSMLRWPLLARTRCRMQDVDSILGMSPLTGSLRLIERHIRERRVSRTTFIVAVYLITNILGRLSVAIFGFAYNMTDETGIEYPILSTNWTSVLWTRHVNTTTNKVDKPGNLDPEAAEELSNSVWNGLREYAKLPKWVYRANSGDEFEDNSLLLVTDPKVTNATLKVK